MKGYTQISPEFPFYFSALIFPKDVKEILLEMQRFGQISDDLEILKVLKIVELFKNIVKNYSALKLKKLISITEINMMLTSFIKKSKEGGIVIKGFYKHDESIDKKIIKDLLTKFEAALKNK